MFYKGMVAVAGPRSLPEGGAGLIKETVGALIASGCGLAVGCCRGADAVALSAAPVSGSRVFAAFGPGAGLRPRFRCASRGAPR